MVSVTDGKRSAQKRNAGETGTETGCATTPETDVRMPGADSPPVFPKAATEVARAIIGKNPPRWGIIQSTAKETAAAARKIGSSGDFQFSANWARAATAASISASVVNQEKLNRTVPWFWVPRARCIRGAQWAPERTAMP